jgi:hypothetical protein
MANARKCSECTQFHEERSAGGRGTSVRTSETPWKVQEEAEDAINFPKGQSEEF